MSKSWANQTISAPKILFREVLKREWNAMNIPRVRWEKKLPVVLSKEEVSKIIQATKKMKHKAFLMLAYSARLRLGEVCGLKPGDIDSQRMVIRVAQQSFYSC